MTFNEPLFFRPQAMEKTAGYKMPTNAKLWQSEIIRYLKSQHPYLPLDTAEIDIRRLDVSKGAAVGSVILDNQVAIPVIISRPRPGADPELAPMDVFFHQGRYRHLNPETVNSAVHSPQVGQPESSPVSNAVGGNPYVGDLTGDATPLEYSGQASPFAGPFSGVKTAGIDDAMTTAIAKLPKSMQHGLLGALTGGGYGALRENLKLDERKDVSLADRAKSFGRGFAKGVVPGAAIGLTVNRAKGWFPKSASFDIENGMVAGVLKSASVDVNDLASVRKMFVSNPAIFQGQGWTAAFHELVVRKQPEATVATKAVVTPNIIQIFRNDAGDVFVKFTGMPATRISDSDLQDMMRDRHREVVRKLKSGKVFVESDGVNRATWDVVSDSAEAKPVTGDGAYVVNLRDGQKAPVFVARQMTTVDGQTVEKKLIIGADGAHAIVDQAFGSRVSGDPRIPSAAPRSGQTGVFVSYVHGTPVPTTPMTVKSVKSVTGDGGEVQVMYTVVDQATGETVTLVPVRGAQAFNRMRVMNTGVDALAEGRVYYMPGDVEWVRLRGRLPVAESVEDMAKLAAHDDNGLVHVTSDGALWSIKTALLPLSGLAGRALGAASTAGIGRRALVGAGIGAAGGAVRHMASNDPNSSLLGNMAAGAGVGALGGVAAPALIQRAGAMNNRAGGWIRGSMAQGVKDVRAAGGAVNQAVMPQVMQMRDAVRAAAMPKQAGYDSLPSWEARELLVAMGMTGDDAESVLGEARRRPGLDRGVKIAGLHAPQLREFDVVEKRVSHEYGDDSRAFAASCRPGYELVKAAAQSGHPQTLDAVLSLEFITPQNLRYFVDSTDDMDETASRLAAMLIAVRLGMPHVAEEPVRQALEGLTRIVNKLRVLKSALDHRSEQAANTVVS